jgi:hypothetical protein
MGKQCGPYYHEGTVQHICFYRMYGGYYLRMKSSLSGKRVKTDPAFARTMQYARLLGKASKIASQVYKTYPKATRKFAEYRTLTGKAMQLLKEGFTEAAALAVLMPTRRKARKAASKKQKAQSSIQKVQHYHTSFTSLSVNDMEPLHTIVFADSG